MIMSASYYRYNKEIPVFFIICRRDFKIGYMTIDNEDEQELLNTI